LSGLKVGSDILFLGDSGACNLWGLRFAGLAICGACDLRGLRFVRLIGLFERRCCYHAKILFATTEERCVLVYYITNVERNDDEKNKQKILSAKYLSHPCPFRCSIPILSHT